jgi:adenosine deaminase CECR1
MLEEHMKKKAELIEADAKQHFSYVLEATLTDAERQANTKLQLMREQIANNHELNRAIHSFFDNKAAIEQSQLFEVLNKMPKGGLHHIHTSAANPVTAYVKLTYDDRVYYNNRDRLFKVYPKHENVEDGYIQCTQLRNFTENFDDEVRHQILLRKDQADGLESHDIWISFQHKFSKVGELGKFVPFFKQLAREALQSCIDQKVYIVEYRHISGMLFDDDKNQVSFLEELRIIKGIVDEIKETTPHFQFKLILTGLKIVGKPHVEKILRHLAIGNNSEDKALADLVAGFDLVNEEDFTPEIGNFAEEILQHKKPIKINGDEMPCFFHCGETHSRSVTNIQDAILLGTKRIGHGFQLQLFPHLQQVCIEQDICVEACPLSNMVLGYTKDLRSHPVNYLMTRGVQFSINSDDPCFFDYEGVTLDYVYATMAWTLTIRDLKKASLNGIKYSSVDQATKDSLTKEVFEPQWAEWIAWLNQQELPEADSKN